jgi:hypothetical protein
VAGRFDVGVVDTPSLDVALARAWLREAAATLMVLQVDPLTVKTLPSALNTLEVVRAFKPSIQILGLLPTMFDQHEEAHSRLLAELLSRRPEAVFTPVVPQDPGLMHRANAEDAPPVGEAARQAYQCAVDRILRVLETPEPSMGLPHKAQQRVTPPWAQASAQAPVQAAPQHQAPAAYQSQPPAQPVVQNQAPPVQAPPPAQAPADATRGGHSAPPIYEAAPVEKPAPQPARAAPDWDDEPEPALEALASSRVEARRPAKKAAREGVPDWFEQGRVDAGGVARRQESWLARSRFAIACTIACLALIAAVVMGTLRRVPLSGGGPAGPPIPAALAATAHGKDGDSVEKETGTTVKPKSRKSSARKAAHASDEPAQTGKAKGN